MSPDRFEIVEEIYHEALALDAEERAGFLLRRCGADAELRREVETLLSYDGGFDSIIDTPPEALAATAILRRQPEESRGIVGRTVNRYRIDSLIGEGGMGKVYLGFDDQLGRRVAVKILAARFASDAGRRERFFREARSASALNHPNILTIHEIGEFEGSYYIVSEFIEGRTLTDYLREGGHTVSETLDIAVQLASALTAAHDAGIVHRDIKPDNVMIRSDRIVKVLDFGIAKLTDSESPADVDTEGETRAKPVTSPGLIIGTPRYMSPEQARGQRIDVRSDIFSFGVVLYEMLSGRPPFSGSTEIDVIGSILKDDPTPISELVPGIAPAIERIVEKSLRKDRETRFQHIRDLLIDLRDAARDLETGGRPVNRTVSIPAQATREDRTSSVTAPRFSFAHVGIIGALVAVVAAAVWYLTGSAAQQSLDLKTAEVATWSSTPGEVYSVGSFSPDGRMVAFASTRSGSKNIWLRQSGAGDAVQVTRDETSSDDPVWSPNGDEIAYFSTRGNRPAIWRMPFMGGAATLVAELPDAAGKPRLWASTGKIYFESKSELFSADVATGAIEQVTSISGDGSLPSSVTVARDGRSVAFVTTADKRWTLNTGSSADAKKAVFTSPLQIRNVTWHPDGRRLLFSSQVDGTFQIFVIPASGGEPRQITFGETDSLVLDVSADGSRVLFGSAKEESDVWTVTARDGSERTVATDIESEFWPDPSPDGGRVVLQSVKNLSQGNRIFNTDIVIRTTGGGDSRTVVARNAFLPKWSPDGTRLAFMSLDGLEFRIETAGPEGEQRRVLTSGGIRAPSFSVLPYNRLQTADFSWSPDGRRIAYVSDRDGRSNVWTVGADGAGDTMVTANTEDVDFSNPIWSDDGRRIAVATRSGEKKSVYGFSIVDTETKSIDPVLAEKSFKRLVGWDSSRDELIVASVDGPSIFTAPRTVRLYRATKGSEPVEFAMLEEAYIYNVHLSPDRKTIAFAAHREGRDNIWLMPAAGGQARRITSNNDSRLFFSSLAWTRDGSAIFFGKQSRFSLLSMLTNFK